MAEQAPNPESRIRLTRKRDMNGAPIVALDWRLAALDRDGMRRSIQHFGQAQTARGHRSVESPLKAGTYLRRSLAANITWAQLEWTIRLDVGLSTAMARYMESTTFSL